MLSLGVGTILAEQQEELEHLVKQLSWEAEVFDPWFETRKKPLGKKVQLVPEYFHGKEIKKNRIVTRSCFQKRKSAIV